MDTIHGRGGNPAAGVAHSCAVRLMGHYFGLSPSYRLGLGSQLCDCS